MELIYFFGRFHVLALHLPIGIIVLAVIADVVARRQRFHFLRDAAPFYWGAAALSAIVTAVLGYMHFAEGGFSGPSAIYHRAFGTALAIAATVTWLMRTRVLRRFESLHVIAGMLVLALVFVTGHFGGNLTHGDTYLTEYAPAPLRSLAGLAPKRAPITDIAMADPYDDIVQPIFTQRCLSCHNEDKQRGGLSLASHEALLRGGDTGSVILAGNPSTSDLFRRITLPSTDDDVMPAEGKPPLTPEQIEIIRWWIESGAPRGETLDVQKLTPDMHALLTAQLGLGGEPVKTAPSDVKADVALVDSLVQAGFVARQRSMTDAHLVVSLVSSKPITQQQLDALVSAADQIVEADLRRARIEDSHLQQLAKLTHLVVLNLAENKITDSGLRHLTGLGQLETLNLHGNAGVTKVGLETLAQLPKLKRLYLWNTGVTPADTSGKHSILKVDLGHAQRGGE